MTPVEARIAALEAEVATLREVVDGICCEMLHLSRVLESSGRVVVELAHVLTAMERVKFEEDDGR